MSIAFGIILATAGAASLAFSMCIQRYALDPAAGEIDKVPLFGFLVPRFAVWFSGLVCYGGANGLYAASLSYGPLSLLAGVFTSLLVWNLMFARCLLREKLTPFKVN